MSRRGSVDEDLLDKNLMSVASSLLYCYSVVCWCLTGGMGIRDCAKKECQEEASVDEDLLDKNLMSVASSLLYCYSVVCWWSDWGYGYKRLC